MPLISDWDPDKDEQGGGLGGGSSGGAPSAGGTVFGGASKQRAKGYTPWDRFASANSGVSSREAGKLQGQVGADVDSAMGGLDKANSAFNKGIAANYTQQGNTTVDPNAQGSKAAAQGAVQSQGFGGSAWSSFGQPAPVAPMQQAAPAPTGPIAAPPAPKGGGKPAKPTGVDSKGNPLVPAAPYVPGHATLQAPPEVTGVAVANGPSGAHDLESSMEPSAWDALTGKITNADAEATQLGSESGVQALLSQMGGQPATGFDAALINGTGQKGFGEAARKFGNGVLTGQQANSEQASQDAWAKLTGNIADQQKVNANIEANKQRDADNARGVVDLSTPATPGAVDNGPPAKSFDEMTANDTEHTMDYGLSGRRMATKNATAGATFQQSAKTSGLGGDAYSLASQFMDQAGMVNGSKAEQDYWNQFLTSLPEGMRNYVNGMIADQDPAGAMFGRTGTYGSGENEGLAPRNSDEQWAWFQQLFKAYMKTHPPSGGVSQTSGGLMSESTKPPK